MPTFLDIDEKRDDFSGDVKHTLGKTDVGIGLRYEILDNNNSRNIHRRPGEVAPLPPALPAGPDRYVTQEDGLKEDMFNVHASTVTRFNEKVMLTLGGSFTTLDTDISGSRIYGSSYDPLYDPAIMPDLTSTAGCWPDHRHGHCRSTPRSARRTEEF